MKSDLESARKKANGLLVVWLVLLIPWFPIAALSRVVLDGGPTTQAYTFIWSIWTYPVPVIIAAIFRKRVPALALLPIVNILCILVSGMPQ